MALFYDSLGTTDAHNHVWIEAVPGVKPPFPPLDEFAPIVEELKEYYLCGGRTILDCQPFGCGRNGNQLLALTNASVSGYWPARVSTASSITRRIFGCEIER
jgi:predicted metal-dependent phosphotriesterase family hydrolase